MIRHPLRGSERLPLPGAKLVGPADPAERLEVTILLRRTATAALQDRVERITRGDFSLLPMTREAFAAKHGASTADIEAVRKIATGHDLVVVMTDAPRRSIVLSGTVARFNKTFGVDLQNYEHAEGTYRGRKGTISMPGELRDIVQAVLGLDNRPQARTHFRRIGDGAAASKKAKAGAASVSYTPPAVAALYDFPTGTGKGETIGIIELGGGYKTADLQTYFKSLKITPPKVTAVSVDHGKNHATGSADGPDGEVMLDIEVAGSIAPQANIVVYFTPNTDAGFLNAITTAIHDTTHKPSIISISWGGPESTYTAQALTAFDEAFQEAVALGITVCVAAGDNGSTDGVTGTANHVDFPASSPHVLACGGTSLRGSGVTISSETVWNDGAQGGATAGGISATFAVPSWQSGRSAALTAGGTIALTMRGMPDIAGDADPETGYAVRVDGSNTVYGGTSAVAPLWAGLTARLNAIRGSSIGFVNPILYAHPNALNDITSGNNGAFAAAKGWDACTGLGSPNGSALEALLAAAPAKRALTRVTLGKESFDQRGKPLGAVDNAAIIKGRADIARLNKGAAKPDAVLIRGHSEPAKPKRGAAEPDALLIRGHDKTAGGKAKPEAFMVRGNGHRPPVPAGPPVGIVGHHDPMHLGAPSERVIDAHLSANSFAPGQIASLTVALRMPSSPILGAFSGPVTLPAQDQPVTVLVEAHGFTLLSEPPAPLQLVAGRDSTLAAFQLRIENVSGRWLHIILIQGGRSVGELVINSFASIQSENRTMTAPMVAVKEADLTLIVRGGETNVIVSSPRNRAKLEYETIPGIKKLPTPFRTMLPNKLRGLYDATATAATTEYELQILGVELANCLSPELKILLRRQDVRTVMLRHDEEFEFPIELCFLDDEADPFFVGDRIAVCRWYLGVTNPPLAGRKTIRQVAFLRGKHVSVKRDEALLQRFYPNRTVALSTFEEVRDLLFRTTDFDLIQFTGHCNVTEEGIGGLEMSNGKFVRIVDIGQLKSERKFTEAQPFVLLNACASARPYVGLTDRDSFAHRFVTSEACGFIGTLWPVAGTVANDFAAAFHEALQTKTVGNALLTAKLAIVSQAARAAEAAPGSDIAAIARQVSARSYCLFAHPDLQLAI